MCSRRIWNSETNISSTLEINILKLCLPVGGPAGQQNATLKPATLEIRHEIFFYLLCLHARTNCERQR
jgi:hypothetical protein